MQNMLPHHFTSNQKVDFERHASNFKIFFQRVFEKPIFFRNATKNHQSHIFYVSSTCPAAGLGLTVVARLQNSDRVIPESPSHPSFSESSTRTVTVTDPSAEYAHRSPITTQLKNSKAELSCLQKFICTNPFKKKPFYLL